VNIANRATTMNPAKPAHRAPAIFLDRDGTLIEEVGYLDRPERVELYPWTIDAIRSLNRAGLRVIVVTNQSGVARGFLTTDVVDQVHAHIQDLLGRGGAAVDAYYYCPHHIDGKVPEFARPCECRKPARGLIDRAVAEFGIDPAQSFTVGDRWLDVALGHAVGGRGILVRTGYGAREEERPPVGLVADAVVNNLIEAVGWILRQAAPRATR
jgi:D-glycero-D-manno-heptose 1,7-bisphosphate phosphatase